MSIIKIYDKMDEINPLKHAMEVHWNKERVRLGVDFAVTEIIDHPRPAQLKKRFPAQLRQDTIETSLPALLGNGTHDVFEKLLRDYNTIHPQTYMVERRLLTTLMVNNKMIRIAGRFDILESQTILWDIKQTSTNKFKYGDGTDFENQLNIYAYMLHLDGINVTSVNALCIFPDWNGYEYSRSGNSYPPNKVTGYQFTLWPIETQKDFFERRVQLHVEASELNDDALPECDREDMWAKPDVWAVYKDADAKRAKLYKDQTQASLYLDTLKKENDSAYLTLRPGRRTRCETWCSAAPLCSQYKEYLKLING